MFWNSSVLWDKKIKNLLLDAHRLYKKGNLIFLCIINRIGLGLKTNWYNGYIIRHSKFICRKVKVGTHIQNYSPFDSSPLFLIIVLYI